MVTPDINSLGHLMEFVPEDYCEQGALANEVGASVKDKQEDKKRWP